MQPRQGIVEIFSTFVQFEGKGASVVVWQWLLGKLPRSLLHCVVELSGISSSGVMIGEKIQSGLVTRLY
ncbi:MAG: hypothetical protein V7K58_18510 [Nostoc sp.]